MVTRTTEGLFRYLFGCGLLGMIVLTGCETPTSDSPPATPDAESVAAAAKATSAILEVEFLSWNLESEGSDPNVIGQQLASMKRYDVYTLSEVLPSAKEILEQSLGKKYVSVVSESGFNDRLAIFFDQTKFVKTNHFEIGEINIKHRYRAPLVVALKDRATDVEFLVMNNHLARGKALIRQKQATQLVDWARTQLMPVVALGDYNFDYVFETKKGNKAFSNMLEDNVWQWVQPMEWIDTNWYDNPQNSDGKDDYAGSMLDFAFVSGPAKQWENRCRVIVRDGDFPDDEKTSDHRPIELIVTALVNDQNESD